MFKRRSRSSLRDVLGEVELLLNLAYASLAAASRLVHDRRAKRRMLLEAALSRTALLTPDHPVEEV